MRNITTSIKRKPLTSNISEEAFERLISINKSLLKHVDKSRSVSYGKIIETLLLKEDAQDYVKNMLLQ